MKKNLSALIFQAAEKTKKLQRLKLHLLGKGKTVKFKNSGYCYCCDRKTKFVATENWFRDYYICTRCNSLPRERALMYCIEKFFPDWRRSIIHESAPVLRGASEKIKHAAIQYTSSQYFPDIAPGNEKNGIRCENLECLTFDDNSFDLYITQDIFEHIFFPDKAFKEIARTLRPGGMHIFTVPLVNKTNPTEECAKIGPDGEIIYLQEPEYHGNPADPEKGSLVTRRWGYDICNYIFESTGLPTKIIRIDAIELGIRAEYIEVLITQKKTQPGQPLTHFESKNEP